uniref:Response regulatory domain-containing protein n=1 Tax=Salix viminalis TaxID=40686 RepID=A0A6N2L405_SALVM
MLVMLRSSFPAMIIVQTSNREGIENPTGLETNDQNQRAKSSLDLSVILTSPSRATKQIIGITSESEVDQQAFMDADLDNCVEKPLNPRRVAEYWLLRLNLANVLWLIETLYSALYVFMFDLLIFMCFQI